MSPLATAKASGYCPHAWLSDVLTRLPTTLDKESATCCLIDGEQRRQGEAGGRLPSLYCTAGLSNEPCNRSFHSNANGKRCSPNIVWKLCNADLQ